MSDIAGMDDIDRNFPHKPTTASELVNLAVQGLQSLNPQSPLRRLMNIAPPASQPLTRR